MPLNKTIYDWVLSGRINSNKKVGKGSVVIPSAGSERAVRKINSFNRFEVTRVCGPSGTASVQRVLQRFHFGMLHTQHIIVVAAHSTAGGLCIGTGRQEAQKEKRGQGHMQGFSR
jgi:hypothetical protein